MTLNTCLNMPRFLALTLGMVSTLVTCATSAVADPPTAIAHTEVATATTQPTTKPSVAGPSEQLAKAIEHYQRSEFDRALALLLRLVKHVDRLDAREANEILTYLAFVHVAFGHRDRAVAAFERALAVRPEMTLQAASPKIDSAFEQAQRRYRARARALDHDPPRLEHQPPENLAHQTQLQVTARARDVMDIKQVTLNYRVRGTRGFNTVTMERQDDGTYIGSIPAFTVVQPGIEYYLAAWDSLGNGPGLKGSPGAPIYVNVQGGPAPTTRPTSTPWYRNWWVWAAVASVAVVGGAVATAVYLGRDEQARLDIHFAGLDPVGGGS